MNEYEKQKTPSFTVNPHDETILIDLSGTICYMSEGASKLFGYQEEENNKLNLTDLFLDLNLESWTKGPSFRNMENVKREKYFRFFSGSARFFLKNSHTVCLCFKMFGTISN